MCQRFLSRLLIATLIILLVCEPVSALGSAKKNDLQLLCAQDLRPKGESIKTPEKLAKEMKNAGKSAKEIAEALKNKCRMTGASVANLLKRLGFQVKEIVKALKKVFNFTALQAAAWLKLAGYSVEIIAETLKAIYNLGGLEVAYLLKQLDILPLPLPMY